MGTAQNDLDFVRMNKETFESCPDESIDYDVMEPLASKGEVVVRL